MIQDNFDDRRKHQRITLKAFAMNHSCKVMARGEVIGVELIDISPGGARLKCAEIAEKHCQDMEYYQNVVLDPCFTSGPRGLRSIPAIIRWAGGVEFGVQFDPELTTSVTELQKLLRDTYKPEK